MMLEGDKLLNLASMVLVGALWGCTNPLLRKGAVENDADASDNNNNNNNTRQRQQTKNSNSNNKSFLASTLRLFLNIKVLLPYLLNQSGSIVFYILLSKSDLSVAVPVCNALALVFSLITGVVIGEPIQKPIITFVGASLVLIGTTICVSSSSSDV